MYGVVLWSDRDEGKAVIWCEDHGDLAYYARTTGNLHEGQALDPGDLIQFQIEEGTPMRRAQNPQLVTEQHSPALAEKLLTALGTTQPQDASPSADDMASSQGNVLSFPRLCTA